MASIRRLESKGTLFMDFRHSGIRLREYTELADTPANRKRLQKALDKIETDIALGTFDYEKTFGKPLPQRDAKDVPATAELNPTAMAAQVVVAQTPNFREFANQWFSETEITWRRSYKITQRGALDKYILPNFGDKQLGMVTKADVLAFRASLWLSSYSNSTSVWSTPVQIGTAAVSGLKITRSDAGGTLIGWLSASSVNPGTQALNLYTVPASGATTTDLLELGSSPFAALKLGLSDANTVVAIWAGSAQSVMLARQTGSTWATHVSLGTGAPASESDLDLVVNADGSDMVAWGGVDPSIHTVLHDNAGTLITNQLVAHGSVSNVRPALASLGSGKYALVFAASSLGGVGVANYEPYSSSYTPGVGWSTPLAQFPNGVSGAGNQQLRADAAGDALAINMGFNLNGYSLASGASAWAVATNIVFGGAVPAFVQERSTGRGVIVWCNNSQLQSAFFK